MWKTILLAFVAVLFCCLHALPQSNASSGEIKGTTTDASGGGRARSNRHGYKHRYGFLAYRYHR